MNLTVRREIALGLLLLIVSAPARLLGLEQLPPGLFHDEAYEGIDAVRILAGARPIFLSENYGREPLYAYVAALFVGVGGPTAGAVRLTSALFGLLAVPAAHFWGRVFFGPGVGLIVAGLTTSSYWLLHESRLGMRPISLPVFLAFASALTWLAARHRRVWAWPLAGVCLGLSLYTYLPARLFPFVIIGQAALGIWAGRRNGAARRSALAGLSVLLLLAGLIALPLLLHFRANPDDFSARGSSVSVFGIEGVGAGQALVQNLVLNLGMFIWRGDDTLRHNLPNRPVFDWLMGSFFLLGLVLSWRNRHRPSWLALWLWLSVMFLPGLLSDSAPHFLRSIGLLPALFALPAAGLLVAGRLFAGVAARRNWPGRSSLWSTTLVVSVLLVSQVLTWRDYFLELPHEPGLEETFDTPRAALAAVAGDPPAGMSVDLPTPGWSYATIRFLRPRTLTPPDPIRPLRARFGPNIVLLGYDLEPVPLRPHRSSRLTLHWRTSAELNASYVETVRLVDAYGRIWWQRQGVPGLGTLPTDTWAPGEYIADHLAVELNPGTPPGELQLEVALAQPDGGRRLTVSDQSGRQLGNSLKIDSVTVGE